MDDVVPISTLYARLGVSTKTTTIITYHQVIDNLDKVKLFHGNYCENQCSFICLPGQTIAGQGGVDITNPRIPFELRSDMNLTLTTCYPWHLVQIFSTIGAATITPLQLSLVLDGFGVQYECQSDITYLLYALKTIYKISEYWKGNIYCRLSLK